MSSVVLASYLCAQLFCLSILRTSLAYIKRDLTPPRTGQFNCRNQTQPHHDTQNSQTGWRNRGESRGKLLCDPCRCPCPHLLTHAPRSYQHGLMMMTWKPNQTPDEEAFAAIKAGIDALPPGTKMFLNSGM